MSRPILALLALTLLLPPVAPAEATSTELGPAGAAPTGTVRPVPGAVAAPFAPPATRYGAGHRGVDLQASPGTAVRAALPGVVRFSGVVAGAGWVTVDHGGSLDTTYGHLDPRLVTAGRRVAAGDVLGRVAEGRAHLDWGARLHGRYIDPLSLLDRWEIHLVG